MCGILGFSPFPEQNDRIAHSIHPTTPFCRQIKTRFKSYVVGNGTVTPIPFKKFGIMWLYLPLFTLIKTSHWSMSRCGFVFNWPRLKAIFLLIFSIFTSMLPLQSIGSSSKTKRFNNDRCGHHTSVVMCRLRYQNVDGTCNMWKWIFRESVPLTKSVQKLGEI